MDDKACCNVHSRKLLRNFWKCQVPLIDPIAFVSYIGISRDNPRHREVALFPPRKDRKNRGQKELFRYFAAESLILDDYILRKNNRLTEFRPIRKKLAKFYTRGLDTPAVDPELMFRIFLLGYLLGLSENHLLRELRMHMGYRWFYKLNPDEAASGWTIPNRLRNHRWTQSGIVAAFLRQVIDQCINQGVVKAPHLGVDGSQVETNASVSQFGPVEVEKTVDKFLTRFELNEHTEAAKSPRIDERNSERSS